MRRAARDGEIVATPRVHRAGKSTVVVEVDAACGSERVAFARLGFARLAARGGFQGEVHAPAPGRFHWGAPSGGFAAPWRDALGVRALEPARGALELSLSPYVGNSLGALQGGLSAALSAFAAEAAGAAALGAPAAALDLGVHFLAPARVGPVRTAATVERVSGGCALVRVELRDAGAQGRLCTLASVGVGPPPA